MLTLYPLARRAAHPRRDPSSRCHRAHATPSLARRPSGFTLLELMVVLAILGMLAAFVAPRYFSQLGRSNTTVAKAQIEALASALDQYRLSTGHYPSTAQGLQALLTAPGGETRWTGPYLKKTVPMDPWNRPYRYTSPGERGEYELQSLGRDGQPGGQAEDADVVSW